MRKTQRIEEMYAELWICYGLSGDPKMQRLIEERARDEGIQSFER